MTAFTGAGILFRLALRRDRVKLAFWVLGVPVVAAVTATSVADLYQTEPARIAYAQTTAASVVARAFNGPASGAEAGAVVAAESYATLAVLTALLTTFAVIRHTRQNEETGRAELIGSGIVGRHAQLVAALAVAVGANLLSGGLIALALLVVGLPIAGSLAYGSVISAVGVAFAGLAAVAAQVSGTSRGANGLAAATVGLAFFLRAVGDSFGEVGTDGLRVTSAWPSWLSPLGWGNQVRAYDANRWWVLALSAGLFVVSVAVAFQLTRQRDLGRGMLPDRRGPASATPRLLSPFGLAWRLQRGGLLGWAVALALLGVAMGAVGDEVDDLLRDNEEAKALLGHVGGTDLTDSYFTVMMGLFGFAVAGYAVQALLRLHTEETGPLEAVLATAVSRGRWLAGHVMCALLGVVVLTVLAGVTTGLGYGLVTGDLAGQLPRMTGAALVQVPAVLVLGGLVVGG
jgi:ABC-2 type transport system permease protein